MLSLIEALPIILRVVQLAPQIQQALRLGQPALDASLAAARHGVVDQAISEHRVAEGPADERCHHRVSQGRVPLSQPKVRKILDTTDEMGRGCIFGVTLIK